MIAFESAARHCNFSRAAEELNTSQSAISRHIAGLEAQLAAPLFDRDNRKLRLSEAGRQYYHAVVSSLEALSRAADSIAEVASGHLTIACTHEVSHLFLMPRFEALQRVMGQEIHIRVMTYEYDTPEALRDPRVDVILAYEATGASHGDRVIALEEAVAPVCAPHFAAAHRSVLDRAVSDWGDLTFLELTKPNRGWASWQDWFAQVGRPARAPQVYGFDNYVYLLEAAAAGRGLALGWRGMIERYTDAGSLIVLTSGFLAFDRPLYAFIPPRAKARPTARTCLAFLGQGDRGT